MASVPPSTSNNDAEHQQSYVREFALPAPMGPLNCSTSGIQLAPVTQYQPQCMYNDQRPQLHLHMPCIAGSSQFNGIDLSREASANYGQQQAVGNLYNQQPMPFIPQSPTGIPSSPSGLAGPIRKRRFSSAKIQPTRIKKVMQSDEEIGRMVASVPVAIGRAMEHFAEKFLLASAAAVTGLNGRTLGPSHMKLAMMANPHFSFLEPLLKEIVASTKQPTDVSPTVQQAPLPMNFAQPNYEMNQLMTAGFQLGASQIPNVSTATQFHSASIEKRRQSNGKEKVDLPPGEKPRRGRPRKVKKEEKLIDDELANVPTERELMPPPAFPIALPRRNGAPGSLQPKCEGNFGDEKPALVPLPGGNANAKLAFQRGALQRQNSQDHGDEEKND